LLTSRKAFNFSFKLLAMLARGQKGQNGEGDGEAYVLLQVLQGN
jgi:hypothetical protein